jgi:hypothetical protein
MYRNKTRGMNVFNYIKGEETKMRIIAAFFLIVFMLFFSGQYCFAQEETVIAEQLTKGDVESALLSGTITSNCGRRGFPDHGATSLNPDTIVIKGIFHKGNEATIHFMGKFKKSIRDDELPVVCEAHLTRLESKEWVDFNNGRFLTKTY